MTKRRWLLLLVAVIGIGAIAPSYVRAYRVGGPSDAPSFLVGDRILANKAAYDIRVPYTGIVIFSHAEPQRGDVVVFHPPGNDATVFKRVIGRPGDTLLMRDNRLEINGNSMQYEAIDGREYQSVASQNELGEIIETETGVGRPHLIARASGAGPAASFGPVEVPAGHYFLMGDNRDNSTDSRMYGSVPRGSIAGKVFHGDRSGP